MKNLGVILIAVLSFGILSCRNAGKTYEIAAEVEKADSCLQDPKHTYEIYIPQRKASLEKLPLVIILDAHGSGKFALRKFTAGANNYPVILAASNRVKNGLKNYSEAIQTLINDVRQKYPANEIVYIAGFSGGARMALGYAQTHPVNGLIVCGALAGADQVKAIDCPVVSISGTDDFNFVETAQYLFQQQSIPENLKIELTKASHSWPDSLMLRDALGFLYLSQSTSVEKSKIKTYLNRQQERIDRLKDQGDFLKASLIARNLSTTTPFNSNKEFTSAHNNLRSGVVYKSQLKKLEKCLKFEMSVRQPYLEALTTKDSLWWKNEIRSINKKLNTAQDSFDVDMYRRIKAFWGIACYSLGNRAIAEKKAAELENILAAYKMLEPDNPDMMYFSAFPFYWKNDTEATISMLKIALEAGFSDTDRIGSDFPERIISKL